MRLFGYRIPFTRDLQTENAQLKERIEMLEKEAQLRETAEKGLRQQCHQLRLDIRKNNAMVDEWMAHYDALQRDLQREKERVVSMKMELGKRGVEMDQAQQMRELREQGRAQQPAQNGEVAGGKGEGAQEQGQKAKREQARDRKQERGLAIGL